MYRIDFATSILGARVSPLSPEVIQFHDLLIIPQTRVGKFPLWLRIDPIVV